MTQQDAGHLNAQERAIARASQFALTWHVGTQVLAGADGLYRVTLDGVPLKRDEILLATVEAGGEVLVYTSSIAA